MNSPSSTEGRRPVFPGFWQAALLCVTFVVAQIVFTIPLAILSALTDLRFVAHPLVIAAISVAAFAATGTFAWFLGHPPLSRIWRFHPHPLNLLLPIALATLGTVILYSEMDNLVRTLLPVPTWMEGAFEGFTEAVNRPLSGAVLLVLVAPITEELLFRGLILRGLLSRFSQPAAILLSTLLFTLVHLNPWQFAGAAGLGLFAGWLYTRTRSVTPGLVAHMIQNLAVCLAPWLPFHIDGFTTADLFDAPVHQPLWFNALGFVLVLIGIGLFLRAAPSSTADTLESEERIPPPPPPREPPPGPVPPRVSAP